MRFAIQGLLPPAPRPATWLDYLPTCVPRVLPRKYITLPNPPSIIVRILVHRKLLVHLPRRQAILGSGPCMRMYVIIFNLMRTLTSTRYQTRVQIVFPTTVPNPGPARRS